MATLARVKALLITELRLADAAQAWTEETRLLGNVPELDSLAVANVISALEREFGVAVYDDEINADIFATLGALAAFVDSKLAG